MTHSLSLIPSALGKAVPGGSPRLSKSSLDGSFGSLLDTQIGLANVVGSQSGQPQATAPSNDPLASLIALLQSGISPQTIVNRIANLVSSAVPKALPPGTDAANVDRLRNSLTKALANALAPPGNGPPMSPAQQGAALAERLTELITAIARGATAGQQSDISGKILDAVSTAKEPPAQREGTVTTSSTLDAASLARSLLATAVATLLPKQPAPASAPPTIASSTQASQAASTQLATQLAPSAIVHLIPITMPVRPPRILQAPMPTPLAADASPSIPSSAASAPDLLARMLVRAASVDARVNGNAAQVAATPVATNASPATPGDLAARFAQALSDVVAQAAASPNGSGSWSFEKNSSNTQSDTPSNDTSTQSLGIPVVSNAPVASQPMAAAPAHLAPLVDPNAIVEQVLKGITMRTTEQGTSEIRLQLSPANLGDVSMKLSVQGNVVSATVVASNADVRSALVSNHHQLAQSLADAGLTLAGFSVDVSGGDAGQQQNRDRTAGFGRRYVVHELPANDPSATPSVTALGPPLLPGQALGLFNSYA